MSSTSALRHFSTRRLIAAAAAVFSVASLAVVAAAPASAEAFAQVSVADTSVAKPTSGTAEMSFPVTLLQPSHNAVRVNYATSDGNAISGRDYEYTAGSVLINPGQTLATVNVPVFGNTATSGNLYFNLNLSSATYAQIQDSSAYGSIIDPVTFPRLAVDDTATVSPYAGGNAMSFSISLSKPSPNTVTVRYGTFDGNARAGVNYTPQNGTVTFSPGATTQTVAVPLIGKVAPGASWYFGLRLNSARNAVLGDDTGYAYVIDNDRAGYFTADDTAVTKPASGTKVVNVPVRLQQPAAFDTSVDYFTSDNSAVAGTDYVATSGTLLFPAGTTEVDAPVTVNTTAGANAPRTFYLNVRDQSGNGFAVLTRNSAIVSIESTGALTPQLSVQDAVVSKPTSGSANVTVTVTAQPAPTSAVSVDYATTDGNALAGTHYTARSGTLTFNAGQAVKTFTVPITGSTLPTGDLYFRTTLSNNSAGTTIVRTQNQISILTADPTQQTSWLSVGVRSITRPTASNTVLQVPVVLSPASANTVTVNYNTFDSSAVAGTDYTATSGTLTFTPGDTVEYVPVTILPNTHFISNDRQFGVSIGSPVNAGIDTSTAYQVVQNGVVPPVLSIRDSAIYRPTLGARQMTFVVSVAQPVATDVTFNWNTFDGSAHDGTDYTATSGTATITAGKNSTKLVVPILASTSDTSQRYFGVSITNVADAYNGRTTGYGYILNDNVTPRISITEGTVTAGASATTMPFTFTLTQPSANPISVNYYTSDGQAVAGTDYTATSGTLSFAPGETAKTVNVPIAANTTRTGTAYFYLNMNTYSNVQQGRRSYAVGAIQYANVTPQISIGDVAVTRQTSGSKNATFTISLTPASTGPVSVNYSTSDGSAVANTDYTPTSGTVNFTPGQTSQTVTVPLTAINTSTPDRYFYVNLGSPLGGSILRGGAYAEIVNTVAPTSGLSYLTVDNSTVISPTSGTATESFAVRMTPAATDPVRVGYYTSDNDAVGGVDYNTAVGTLTFAPGQTSKTVTATVLAEKARQNPISFYLNLRSLAGPATYQRTSAYGVILNQQINGHISAGADVGVVRGTTGTHQQVTVTVTMSPSQAVPVSFDYRTEDESAVAGRDYDQQNGTVTFAPGQTSKTITLDVYGDTRALGDERFSVVLENASNGGIYYGEDSRAYIYLDATQTFDLTGIVTDQNGAPVAGATLTRTGNNQPTATTTSAADGTFGFNAVQGTYKITPSGLGQKYFPTSVTTQLLPGQETATTAGAFIAYTGNAIAGKTFDSAGTPLAGATVTRTGASQPTVSVTSNARGVWLITTSVNGSYTLNASATGYDASVPANYPVTYAGTSVLDADLALVKKPYIVARIVDTGGNPVTNATVTFAGPVTRTVKANVHGYYAADKLPAGTYTVTPSAPGKTFTPASANATVNTTTNGSVSFTQN